MSQQMQLPLLYVNGGEPHITKCANCGEILGDARAASRGADGKVRFFCAPEKGDDPQYSCFVVWTRRHH